MKTAFIYHGNSAACIASVTSSDAYDSDVTVYNPYLGCLFDTLKLLQVDTIDVSTQEPAWFLNAVDQLRIRHGMHKAREQQSTRPP